MISSPTSAKTRLENETQRSLGESEVQRPAEIGPPHPAAPLHKMNAQVSSSAGNWVAVAMVMAVHCEGVDVSCQLSLWLLWLEVTNLVNTFAGWPPIILSHVP